jgi:sigma-B regulation protein RsbU (phosphoserine phosphatase)
MSLRRQMIVWIAGPALVIYLLVLGLAARSQYRQSLAEVEQAATRLTASYASRFDGQLREVAHIATTTAKFLESGVNVSDEQLFDLLTDNVRQSPLVYGSCLAFEPGTRRPADELFAPYVYRDKQEVNRINIDRSVYDWYRDPQYTWFTQPKKLNRGVWSEPYLDKGAGGILMSTFSAPFHDQDKFGGVCTVDIDLARLRETVGKQIDGSLDFVLLAADGRYVFHPEGERIMAQTMIEYVPENQRTQIESLAKQMLSGNSGAGWLDRWDDRESVGVFYAPIPSMNWVFVSRVPTASVLRSVRDRTLLNGLAILAALALIGVCIYVVAGRIAAPIAALEQGVLNVQRGNLEARVNESASTTEVQHLAQSFNRMTAELRANLERLAVEKLARQRMELDLEVARRIQQDLLPATKPSLPLYDIAGWNRAADKTGGDYYDWQLLPNNRLLVSVADVTGHGIGPALVAAVCRAYARAAEKDRELDSFMQQLNNLLVDDMPEGRFVTFAGLLLDPELHEARMLSAGHGPLFRCVIANDKLIETEADGVPLGLMSEAAYGPSAKFTLAAGDFVLLVTDGLFEWANEAGENFGLERLRHAIRSVAQGTADEIIRGLYRAAEIFAGSRPQEDDVTIVVIRRLPS